MIRTMGYKEATLHAQELESQKWEIEYYFF